ncbi:MAG TPA: hypothetical protein VLW45_13195 [Pelomicrobium sp.]|nr:hypothetical protein [Pelomicrobium sp.]
MDGTVAPKTNFDQDKTKGELMKRSIGLSLVGSALLFLSTSAVSNSTIKNSHISLLQGPGTSAGQGRSGSAGDERGVRDVHDKTISLRHGQATLNAYLDAHCLAAPDAVAVGGGFAGACGALRVPAPGSAKN